MQKPDYDALIIGGGPAGSTAALLLARAGWSVVLVEKAIFPRRKVCGEFLSATNLPLFEELGVAEEFRLMAGPAVESVGLFAGESIFQAPMPHPQNRKYPSGQALGRDKLDALLLDRAKRAGATILQPYRVTEISAKDSSYHCQIKAAGEEDSGNVTAHILIAAHGSWEPGSLPTQPQRKPARGSDLFGFKARFRGASLQVGLMPLLSFPGGYGGMVHTDDGLVSFSCCIRRDRLTALRAIHPQMSAAEAVFAHIQTSCKGVREALAGTVREEKWLTVGPIQPGIRLRAQGSVFLVGNAAGEAHPAIAEGISIAIQSARLLTRLLIARQDDVLKHSRPDRVAREYTRLWRKQFAGRIYASSLFAAICMSPTASRIMIPVLKRLPQILTWGAWWSGKATAEALSIAA